MSVSIESDPVYERFHFLVNAPALFNAVVSAVELNVFSNLSVRPGATAEELRTATGLPAHQLRVLLQAVCSTGLVVREGSGYVNSPVAQELLASDAPDSWAHILPGWKSVYYPAFMHMTRALRTGRNTALDDHPGTEPTLYGRLPRNPELEAVFHRAMSAFTLRSVDSLIGRREFSGVRHLLDVGGGDGSTSLKLAARYPELISTVFDIPSISKMAADKTDADAEEQGTAAGISERVRLQAGDIFADPFPSGVDAVLFSHVLEIFSEEQILVLLKKAYDALPVGGQVFAYGFNVSDDETEGVFSARLGLYFNVLVSGRGMAYPAKDYERWLREVGFAGVRTVSGLPYEHGLSLGIKE
ncbi:methyltransferase [Streptomyces uncialis]|uniref:methyltransferase n=1 Tax=Streptomyces uncialis TaxID=1048205 RepID=UPI0036676AE5